MLQHWRKFLRGVCFVILVAGTLVACTNIGIVPDRTTTSFNFPVWHDMNSDSS
jgi:hypothetical protein